MKARDLLSLLGLLGLFGPPLLACHGCREGAAGAPPTSAGGPAGVIAVTEPGDAASQPGAETVIGIEDDGKSFDVARGSTVAFKLASHAGTGYAWVPTQVEPGVLTQQGDRTNEVSSDAPGAPKLDVYRFVAAASGSTTVELSLRRSFGGPPGKTIHVTINVR
jgi:predicted secreted protein